MAALLILDTMPGSPLRPSQHPLLMPATPRKPTPGPRVDRKVIPFSLSLPPVTPHKTQRRYPFHCIFHFYDRQQIQRSTFLYAAQDEARYREVTTRGDYHPRLLEDFLFSLPRDDSPFNEYAWPMQNGSLPMDEMITIHVYFS